MKTVFMNWEGVPAILGEYEDGRMYGFVHTKGAWQEANAADIGEKGRVVTEAQFGRMFGKLGLPVFPK